MARARSNVDFDVDGLDEILDGFKELSQGASRPMREEWAKSSGGFHDKAQETVHVITGALKATGRVEFEAEPEQCSVELSYGGPIPAELLTDEMLELRGDRVDYAQFEQDRGGSHDWLNIAFAATSMDFTDGLERGFVDTWK
jgi:hypothetical protein